MSNLINWWAKYISKVFIPKWMWRFYWLSYCDFCGGNLIGKCDHIVDYRWAKVGWDEKKEYKLGYIYAHANKSDCDANKWLNEKQEEETLKIIEEEKLKGTKSLLE